MFASHLHNSTHAYYRSHGLNVRIGTFKIMHQTSKHVLCRRVHSVYLTMVYIRSRG